jgi:hypothetical protein
MTGLWLSDLDNAPSIGLMMGLLTDEHRHYTRTKPKIKVQPG